MAIYRTRTHYDIETSRYEHEYIINNYSTVCKYLRIETPQYSVQKEDCKYQFIIEPRRRSISIRVETTFAGTCTDQSCLDVTAECYDDSRMSTSSSRKSSSNNHHHSHQSSRRSHRSSPSSHNGRLITLEQSQIVNRRRTGLSPFYDSSDDSFDGLISQSEMTRMTLRIDEDESIRKIRIKIRCSYNRLLANDCVEPSFSTLIEHPSNDLTSFEAFRDKVPYDFHIDIGTHRYATHRNILMLRSDYFKTLFESQFNDCSKNQLKLHDDIDHTVFGILLKYFYTDRLEENEISESILLDLFKLSDRFLITSLRRKCLIELLRTYVNKDNVFSYLSMLDTYVDCDELRDKCLDLFHKNPSLLKTTEFAQLEKNNAKLAFQIYGSFF